MNNDEVVNFDDLESALEEQNKSLSELNSSTPLEEKNLETIPNQAPIESNTIDEQNVEETTFQAPVSNVTETNEQKLDKIDVKDKKKFTLKFKKNTQMPLALTLIIVIIFFVIGLLFGKTFFSKTIVTSSISTVNKNSLKSDGSKNTTNINGVTYQIPSKYTYDKTLKGVLVTSNDDTFRIFMRTENASYSIMRQSLTSIKETLKTKDLAISNIKEVDVLGKKTIAIEATNKLVNRLIAYTEATKDNIFYIEIVTNDNKFNYDVLNLAMEILKDTKVEKTTSKMENIDVYDISDLAIAATNTYNRLKN